MPWPAYRFDEHPYEYDVCLSFAGEQREYVEEVACHLECNDIRVFYDDFQKSNLWGKDLYEHLSYIYSQAARFCILFISKEYAEKIWTSHERKSAQARALRERTEYILPVLFDDTSIPGILPTVGYLDARVTTAEEVSQHLIQKIERSQKKAFVPEYPIALYQTLNLEGEAERSAARDIAQRFALDLSRATLQERRLFFYFILRGCPRGSLSDPHVAIGTAEREFGIQIEEIKSTLNGMRSLHVEYHTSSYCDGRTTEDAIHIQWRSRERYGDPFTQTYAKNYSNRVITAMVRASIVHICDDCIELVIDNLDFSSLRNDISDKLNRDMPEADFLPFEEY
ncbi:TIR domain-containing protein [Microbispora bryophytorum]|uniref:toll/interleukin-1 receptor domain-containing protein n=1 Tax=Microbispora bryophytorum TaxID=1460882 RepID=UPI003407C96F